MRHDDKTKARIRIGKLLNICRKCPYGGHRNGSRYVKQCGTCDVYKEMRTLGEWLINDVSQRPERQEDQEMDRERT